MLKLARVVVAVFAMASVAVAGWQIASASRDVEISYSTVGYTPVSLYNFTPASNAPIVVIAHGFAGSQQLMLPFALTLARNGFRAVTFDFIGHGRNPEPMRGDITKETGVTSALVAELGRVVDSVAPEGSKMALLGHSMATDIVVRYAKDHPSVEASVAVSMFSPAVTAANPRNLLVIVGAAEPQFLKDEALRAVAMQSVESAQPSVTYGDFNKGTARRASFSEGVEHIGVLYSVNSLKEATQWFGLAFNIVPNGALDARGPWLGLLFGGLIALTWPLAGLLPHLLPVPNRGLAWPRLWPLAIGPAIATPLILWKLPTDFLTILLGDYLTAHMGIYGLLTVAGLWWAGALPDAKALRPALPFAASALAVAGWSILAFGIAIDFFVTSFLPIPTRFVLIPAVLAGTLPWFLADEWLTHGRRGAYAFTKLCFLLSLAGAVALNLERLFFLIIIIPVMLVFLIVYGLFSRWAFHSTSHPLVAGAGNALALAWAIAVTFPLFAKG